LILWSSDPMTLLTGSLEPMIMASSAASAHKCCGCPHVLRVSSSAAGVYKTKYTKQALNIRRKCTMHRHMKNGSCNAMQDGSLRSTPPHKLQVWTPTHTALKNIYLNRYYTGVDHKRIIVEIHKLKLNKRQESTGIRRESIAICWEL